MAEEKKYERLELNWDELDKVTGGEDKPKVASTTEGQCNGFGPTLICPKCGNFSFVPLFRINNSVLIYACLTQGCGAGKQVQLN